MPSSDTALIGRGEKSKAKADKQQNVYIEGGKTALFLMEVKKI